MSRTFLPHVITDDSALGGSVIQRSLRFNDNDSPYLERTPSGAGSNQMTFSFWIKRGNLALGSQAIFSSGENNARGHIYFDSSDQLNCQPFNSSSANTNLVVARLFRDPAAWYHVVLSFNNSAYNDTASTVNVYVNGVSASFTPSVLGTPTGGNRLNDSSGKRIGELRPNSGGHLDGYLAEFNFIDGQVLDPSHFGYTESQTGLWRPKRYEGTYGTNGYYLDFSDNSSTSALGIDKSPNGNDWSVNNFSVSAGVDDDSMIDTPTNNFPTWHPLYTSYQSGGTTAYSDGNLKLNTTTGSPGTLYPFGFATFGARSGKWYAEFKCDTNGVATGVANTGQLDSDITGNPYGATANTSIIYTSRAAVRTNNGNLSGSFPTYASGDIIGVALDLDNNKIYFHKNGTYINSGNPNTSSNGFTLGSLPSGRTGDFVFSCGSDGAVSIGVYANFGQRAFNYDLPTGYKSMCSKNLPPDVPSIIKPKKLFDTVLWTGNGGTSQTVTGLEFQPDFVWLKDRVEAGWHRLQNSVVGANKLLYTNSENSEVTNEANGYVSSFTKHGFVVADTDDNGGGVNKSGNNYVAWCWKAGGASVTNNDGSKTVTLSANQEAGFSIIQWDGSATNATCGHGLGKKPSWFIVKSRTHQQAWFVYHAVTGATKNPRLNDTATPYTNSNIWNDTEPTDTVLSLGSSSAVNGNGNSYICYCWAEIPGYSRFGSYIGNGSTDGTYVYLGFRPAWVMIKNIEASDHWNMTDSTRFPTNVIDASISANLNNAEGYGGIYDRIDYLSNGFKYRQNNSQANWNGQKYIYMAFAEQPNTTAFETFPNPR